MVNYIKKARLPVMSQQQFLPQAYLTNFHNRIRNEDVPIFVTAQPSRGHKRAKVVNYAEFDTDIFDEFANVGMGMDMDSRSGSTHPANTAGDGGANGPEDDKVGGADGAVDANGDPVNGGNGNHVKAEDVGLPDIQDQDDQLSILRYPKIRETFLQSKVATPYRLDIPPPLSKDQQEPIIIPISLNLEHGGHTITDFFTWNINDHSMTPEEFATIYCRDLDFPNSSALHSQIISTINERLQEYETHNEIF